jgi:hypothetical protein
MIFVLPRDFIVGLDARRPAGAVVRNSCYEVSGSRILIDPLVFQPQPRITFVRCDQLKALRVGSGRMAEGFSVRREQEVIRLDLVSIPLSLKEMRVLYDDN